MTGIQRVGFVGLGIMGSRMAKNLASRGGFEVVVWNRSREKADALAKETPGLKVADSAAAVARTTDAFCTCVADPAALESVTLGERGLFMGAHEGQLYVDFSTVGAAQWQALEKKAQAQKLDFLAAPVTGSKNGAEKGTLLVMAGGNAGALERARPVLAAVSEKTIHCGSVSDAAQVKLAGNALIAIMLQGLSEGLLLAAKSGVAPEKVLEVIQASGYRSPYFEFKGGQILKRDFSPHFAIDLMFKDLNLFLESAGQLRVPTPAVSAVREAYQLARAQGLGQEDIAAVVKALETLTGTEVKATSTP